MPNENTIVHRCVAAVKNSAARFQNRGSDAQTKCVAFALFVIKKKLLLACSSTAGSVFCVRFIRDGNSYCCLATHCRRRMAVASTRWIGKAVFTYKHRTVHGYTLSCYIYVLVVVGCFVHGPKSNRIQRLEFSYCFAMRLYERRNSGVHTHCVRTCFIYINGRAAAI